MGGGYIKLHRSLLDWGWYSDGNTVRVFLHLLLSANHKDGEYLGHKVLRGQVVFGRKELSEALLISEDSIRTAIEHLRKTGELTTERTNRFTVGTIVNYGKFQDCSQHDAPTEPQQSPNNAPTETQQNPDESPAEPQQVPTSKNMRSEEEQEVKKERPPAAATRFMPPTVEDVAAYCRERGNGIDPQEFVAFYTSKGWLIGKSPMKDWKATVWTWERKRRGANGATQQNGPAATQRDPQTLPDAKDVLEDWMK